MNFMSEFSLNDFLYMTKGLGVSITLTLWAVFFGTLMGIIFGFVRSVVGFFFKFYYWFDIRYFQIRTSINSTYFSKCFKCYS